MAGQTEKEGNNSMSIQTSGRQIVTQEWSKEQNGMYLQIKSDNQMVRQR